MYHNQKKIILRLSVNVLVYGRWSPQERQESLSCSDGYTTKGDDGASAQSATRPQSSRPQTTPTRQVRAATPSIEEVGRDIAIPVLVDGRLFSTSETNPWKTVVDEAIRIIKLLRRYQHVNSMHIYHQILRKISSDENVLLIWLEQHVAFSHLDGILDATVAAEWAKCQCSVCWT